MPDIVDSQQMDYCNYIKGLMAIYNESEDLINIGAYKEGTNSEIDESIRKMPDINRFLQQKVQESSSFDETIEWMQNIIR